MHQITAQIPDLLVEELDTAAKESNQSREDIVRQAIERYLEDFDDVRVARERLGDPTDPVLDWNRVRHELPAGKCIAIGDGRREAPRLGATVNPGGK